MDGQHSKSVVVPIERLDVGAWTIPTSAPESDGTLCWDRTTIVVVEARGGGEVGVGFSYAHAAAATLVDRTLRGVVEGQDALAVGAAFEAMRAQVRNLGGPGIASCAIGAVDTALWDLKARLLGVPLVVALDAVHEAAPLYGSGGFTSMDDDELCAQLAGWAQRGIGAVKIKVGREPGRDPERVARARAAVGPDVDLMVDANGAWTPKKALAMAARFAEQGVVWFEEPVSSDDRAGLRMVRDHGPPGMDIAAGEYGSDEFYFRDLLEAHAVDVLQIDATRAGGFTGFLRAAALAGGRGVDVSAHTSPQLHAHVCCAVERLRHVEYFHDHVRIERELFEGTLEPVDGALRPDRSRSGNGLVFRRDVAERMSAGG